jgi:hypothetical protein
VEEVEDCGVNGAPDGLNWKLGGKESLMPMNNGCDTNARGPPLAPAAFRKPARKSIAFAVRG